MRLVLRCVSFTIRALSFVVVSGKMSVLSL